MIYCEGWQRDRQEAGLWKRGGNGRECRRAPLTDVGGCLLTLAADLWHIFNDLFTSDTLCVAITHCVLVPRVVNEQHFV